MRAVVLHEPGPPTALRLEEVDTPEPGVDEISIDVAFAGTGLVDRLFRTGAVPVPLPLIPGIEVTGTVRALGEGVTRFEVGQRVGALLNDFGRTVRAGGYAEVVVAHESMATAIPDAVSLPVATAVLVNGVTAWVALRDLARAGVDDAVLVLGASGGLGGTTVRMASALPTRRVVGVVSRDPARAPEQCTDVVLTEDLGDWLEEHPPDVVIDPVGGEPRRRSIAALAPFGRLVVLGNATGDDVDQSVDALWGATTSVVGFNLGGAAHLRPAMVRTSLAGVVDLLARGVLREPDPVVRPLEEAVVVHEAFEDRTAPPKTVLEVGG